MNRHALAVVLAQQNLEIQRAERIGQRHDGLHDHRKTIGGKCAGKFTQQPQLKALIGQFTSVVLLHHNLCTLLLAGGTGGPLGHNQGIARFDVGMLQFHQPHRALKPEWGTADHQGPDQQIINNALGQLTGLLKRDVGKENQKFRPRHAAQLPVNAQNFFDTLANLAQDVIASRLAVQIIDGFQRAKLEITQQERFPCRHTFDAGAQLDVDALGVHDPGQRVLVRLQTNARQGIAMAGDILQRPFNLAIFKHRFQQVRARLLFGIQTLALYFNLNLTLAFQLINQTYPAIAAKMVFPAAPLAFQAGNTEQFFHGRIGTHQTTLQRQAEQPHRGNLIDTLQFVLCTDTMLTFVTLAVGNNKSDQQTGNEGRTNVQCRIIKQVQVKHLREHTHTT